MATISCIIFWIVMPVIILFVLLGRLTETRHETIHRLRRQGMSQQAIATKLQISRYRVRKALA